MQLVIVPAVIAVVVTVSVAAAAAVEDIQKMLKYAAKKDVIVKCH